MNQDGERSTDDGQDEMKFEAALARLEEIVRALERGDASLEESLAFFEEGIRLVERCRNSLSEAQGALERLVAEGTGTTPLDLEEGR